MKMRTRTGVALAAAAVLLMPQMASAADSTLPGGTSISIDNTSPTDGDEFLVPLSDATLDITDEGTAQVGAAEVVKDTSLVFVMDTSGSTGASSGVDCDGGGIDTVLQCEKVGALVANSAAADTFSAIANAAVVQFATGAGIVTALTSDFTSTAAGINSLTSGGLTNYAAGLTQAQAVLAGSSETNAIVLFLSDGDNTEGGLAAVPDFGANTVVRAFAIGTTVSCTGDLVIAAEKGNDDSGCQQVTDPATLGDAINEAIGASLDAIDINVDSGGYTAIPAGDIDISLPTPTSFAAKTANWSTTVAGLAPGLHEICVRATGTDVGGTGTVSECKSIRLLQLQNDGTEVDATNELGEDNEHTINVVVAGDDGGRDVTFDVVSGPNSPAVAVVQTDADGKASFSWTSPQDPSGLGTDTVEVSITVDGETQTLVFTKEWVDTTPPTAECLESVNPNGNTPQAPGKGG
ncbi:MAG TPA: VWA domain-containing protein, partial [Nitriliruptoraceae bacterium]|nr:VWA domain-containing protein [Nitriliruptoraceae bacterium]